VRKHRTGGCNPPAMSTASIRGDILPLCNRKFTCPIKRSFISDMNFSQGEGEKERKVKKNQRLRKKHLLHVREGSPTGLTPVTLRETLQQSAASFCIKKSLLDQLLTVCFFHVCSRAVATRYRNKKFND
jgi:hypothetical protein